MEINKNIPVKIALFIWNLIELASVTLLFLIQNPQIIVERKSKTVIRLEPIVIIFILHQHPLQ